MVVLLLVHGYVLMVFLKVYLVYLEAREGLSREIGFSRFKSC
jgi:hypothetical protein